jgi:hypothetical protein
MLAAINLSHGMAEVKVFIYPTLCDFWENHCLWKMSRLHQFTFLVME